MKNARDLFHKISYLQYPLMIVGAYYVLRPFIYGMENIWVDYNKMLVFYGLAISFSTLQDTTKTQNKVSENIWKNPRKAKILIIYFAVFAFALIVLGLFCLLGSTNKNLNEISFGVLALGVGMVGLLKSAIEMAEYQQRENNVTQSHMNR